MVHRSTQSYAAGVALVPQSIAAAGTANGATITNAPKVGRTLAFLLIAGATTSVTTLTVKPQGRLDANAAWEDIPDDNGNPIQFDAADTAGGSANELHNGLLRGTLLIDRLPYMDYRLVVSAVAGATVLLGAAYTIGDLYETPAGRKDHFLFKSTPYDETAPLNTING